MQESNVVTHLAERAAQNETFASVLFPTRSCPHAGNVTELSAVSIQKPLSIKEVIKTSSRHASP